MGAELRRQAASHHLGVIAFSHNSIRITPHAKSISRSYLPHQRTRHRKSPNDSATIKIYWELSSEIPAAFETTRQCISRKEVPPDILFAILHLSYFESFRWVFALNLVLGHCGPCAYSLFGGWSGLSVCLLVGGEGPL